MTKYLPDATAGGKSRGLFRRLSLWLDAWAVRSNCPDTHEPTVKAELMRRLKQTTRRDV